MKQNAPIGHVIPLNILGCIELGLQWGLSITFAVSAAERPLVIHDGQVVVCHGNACCRIDGFLQATCSCVPKGNSTRNIVK